MRFINALKEWQSTLVAVAIILAALIAWQVTAGRLDGTQSEVRQVHAEVHMLRDELRDTRSLLEDIKDAINGNYQIRRDQ